MLVAVFLCRVVTEMTCFFFMCGVSGLSLLCHCIFFLMIRRPPRSTLDRSSAASDVYKRQVPDVLIEIWQANSAGRYTHELDSWNAPVDPNFTGRGRCWSNEEGVYRFLTVRPGAYPWKAVSYTHLTLPTSDLV